MYKDAVIRIEMGSSLRDVLTSLGGAPDEINRARKRARRGIEAFAKRQILRAVSQATGASQKTLTTISRIRFDNSGEFGLSIWIGTDPIKLHHLGKVSWTMRTPSGRLTKGARVGRTTYPGTWSWGQGSFTGPAVMQRIGDDDKLIEAVGKEIHTAVKTKIESISQEISERYQSLLHRELNYAINVEGGK